MPQRTKLYSLMAQKEKVALGKTARTFAGLTKELDQNAQTCARIESLIAEKDNDVKSAQTKYQLQTSHAFSVQLSDQLEISQSQNELLKRQMQKVQKTLVQQEHKLSHLNDRHSDAKRKSKNDQN